MKLPSRLWTLLFLATTLTGCGQAASPDLAWEGTWEAAEPVHGGELRCTLQAQEKGQWQGKFTGYCSNQFAYEVQMQGRRDGEAILFEGEANLGEKDGGIYHWTGRIAGAEFTGQYRSASGKTGKFE